MSTSPSAAILTSLPGITGPTVPNRLSSGWFTKEPAEDSVIP